MEENQWEDNAISVVIEWSCQYYDRMLGSLGQNASDTSI